MAHDGKSAAKEESLVKVKPLRSAHGAVVGMSVKRGGRLTIHRGPTPTCPAPLSRRRPDVLANVPARHLDTVPVSLDWTAISFRTYVSRRSFFFLATHRRNTTTFHRFSSTLLFLLSRYDFSVRRSTYDIDEIGAISKKNIDFPWSIVR